MKNLSYENVFLVGLTGSIATLLLRVDTLETENSILQEKVDNLEGAAAQQDQINTYLQANDNSTNDRLQVVETDLQEVEVAVQGSVCFKIHETMVFGVPFLNSTILITSNYHHKNGCQVIQ